MTNKIKLLLVADTYYPKIDGILMFMEQFIKRSEKDFSIHLLVPFLGKRKGNNVTYLESSKFWQISGYPSIKFSLANLKKIKTVIKESDLVFIQGPALISYLSIYYSHKLRKKTVFYMHTIAWELFEKFFPPLLNRFFFKLIKKGSIIIYNLCDSIMVPYPKLKSQLQQQGVKASIDITRLGVDIERFTPAKEKSAMRKKLNLPIDASIIGYVGRVSKEKNIDVLFQAFQKIHPSEKVHLLIVGGGPQNQIKKYAEIPHTTVTGFVYNVEDYFKAMDIFVMPSLTETTSLTTLEAMATGLPVIVSKIGFMKHYIIKNYNGFFFPKNNATMLAIKIEKLLLNKELQNMIGHNARKTVAYAFSWERSINRIKKVLRTALYKNDTYT